MKKLLLVGLFAAAAVTATLADPAPTPCCIPAKTNPGNPPPQPGYTTNYCGSDPTPDPMTGAYTCGQAVSPSTPPGYEFAACDNVYASQDYSAGCCSTNPNGNTTCDTKNANGQPLTTQLTVQAGYWRCVSGLGGTQGYPPDPNNPNPYIPLSMCVCDFAYDANETYTTTVNNCTGMGACPAGAVCNP